jgi:hypothetical protein
VATYLYLTAVLLLDMAGALLQLLLAVVVAVVGGASAQAYNALVVGGDFKADADVLHAARWYGGVKWAPLGGGMDLSVHAYTAYRGRLVAGGLFFFAGGVPCNHIAQYDGATNTWSALGSGTSDIVWALVVDTRDRLVAGGFFTFAGGVPAAYIAQWDGATWAPLGGGLSRPVTAVVQYGACLIAAGYFDAAGGVPASGVACWDGAAWSALGAGVSSDVYAAVVYANRLVVGGLFRTAGGQDAQFIAQWDGAAWSPLGAGVDATVDALAVYNGRLVVGGAFSLAANLSAPKVAQWDGQAWSAIGEGFSGYGVRSLATFNGWLFAGGDFVGNGAAATTVARLARWKDGPGATWQPVGAVLPDTVVTVYVWEAQAGLQGWAIFFIVVAVLAALAFAVAVARAFRTFPAVPATSAETKPITAAA